ncbi:MAG: ATP-dependent DNA helicase RecG, partial [Chloroflexi bacterium]|nr:ATP-dependent DNA helicase RecG [Chloroflexota bacterium]
HLQGLGEALQQIHFPDSMEQARQARDRLAFDELLLLQLGVLRKRQDWRSEPGIPIASEPGLVHDLEAHLPYTLTGAQQRAISEILQDMTRSVPMSRLLQGDVGSGKTIVALAAILTAVRAGFQAALMAPTSILAEQHMRTISGILEYYPKVRMGLLLGGQTALEKEAMRRALAEGEIDLVVGTHALIQDEVSFKRLGLVVVDEQHRFGVEQRQTLRAKSIAWSPHLLAMSATPIPRTLALTLYGDMELSVLDELPPNRQPVVTAVRTASSREGIYRFIRDQISAGHQAYIIYPLVEESEAVEARAAVEEHDRLAQEVFPQLRLGLLHGRIGAEEKERVMSQFREGQLDILVSTAVVEVGMDVPNATVMLIEGAERFGLAQLHQFRGRVGRGSSRSYCILVSDSTTEESLQRLQIMAETEDGFVLAEKDLEMRGPGDFIGVRQSGLPELRLAQVTDRVTLEQARAEALQIFAQDPDLSESRHRALAEHAEAFWRPVSPA